MSEKQPVIIIVDPQRAYIDPAIEGNDETLRAFDSIQILRTSAAKAGIPVVIVEFTGPESIPISEGGELMMTPKTPNEYLVQKTSRSAFGHEADGIFEENTAFTHLLADLNAGAVFITGYKTPDCVYRTAYHAPRFGYETHVVADATATGKPRSMGGEAPHPDDFSTANFIKYLIESPERTIVHTQDVIARISTGAARPPAPAPRAGAMQPL